MKRKVVITLSVVFGLILTTMIYTNMNDLMAPFVGAPLLLLIPYFLTTVVMHGFHAWRWKTIFEAIGYKLKLPYLYILRIMGYSVNYITPTAHVGGEPLKVVFLKQKNVDLTDSASAILLDKSFEMLAAGTLGLFGAVITGLYFALPSDKILPLIILSFLSIAGIIAFMFRSIRHGYFYIRAFRFLKLKKFKKLKKFEKTLKQMSQNFKEFFINKKRLFVKAVLISVGTWALMFLEYGILLWILGFKPTIFQLFIIISFVGLAYFIPIPAALGVLEAGQISAFSILGLNPALGIATSIIIRSKDLVVTLIGLLILSFKGATLKEEPRGNLFLTLKNNLLSGLRRFQRKL